MSDPSIREKTLAEQIPKGVKMSRGLLAVLVERNHQINDLGFDADHDDTHQPNELPQASAAYMMHAVAQLHPMDGKGYDTDPPPWWPWEVNFWKPQHVRENLVRSVALGLAAIEAYDRANPPA
jgi:hypothetical protein